MPTSKPAGAGLEIASDMKSVINYIYSHEMNCQVDTFWDGGFNFKLGDDLNGFIDSQNFESIDDGVLWLLERFKRYLKERRHGN